MGGAWLDNQLCSSRAFFSPSMEIPGYYLRYIITVSFQAISIPLFVEHPTNDLHSLNMTVSRNNLSDCTFSFLSSDLITNTKIVQTNFHEIQTEYHVNAKLALLNFHKQYQQYGSEAGLVPCNARTRGSIRSHRSPTGMQEETTQCVSVLLTWSSISESCWLKMNWLSYVSPPGVWGLNVSG